LVPVDFHTIWVDLPDRTWGQILEHSSVVSLRSVRVRIPGAEDALRMSCLHLLRHATEMPPRCNPLWLCDVSVMLEGLPADFDWNYCLSGNTLRTQWMLAVIRLANHMFGARVEDCPPGRLPSSVPSWVSRTFLSVWGQRQWNAGPRPLPRPLSQVRRDLRELPRVLAERWPAPLESVYRLSWPITRASGPIAQVVDYAARALSWGPRQVGTRGQRRRRANELEVRTTL
jgi:hypothetical protein